MNRRAIVLLDGTQVGIVTETDTGYTFQYDEAHFTKANALPISLTLPVTATAYRQTVLFPFFDGLIPEGWLLDIAERNWKLQANDRFGLLLACCQDCIGAVSIIPVSDYE